MKTTKSRSPQPSSSVRKPKSTVNDSSTTTDQSADSMRIGSIDGSKDAHQRTRNNRRMSEDKENIYKNSNDSNLSKIPEKKTKCVKRKPPVSYTVLFDKKQNVFANQTFMVSCEMD